MLHLCPVLIRSNNLSSNNSSTTKATNSLSTTSKGANTTIPLLRNIIKCLALWSMSNSPSNILNHSLSNNSISSSKLRDKVTLSTLATLFLVNISSITPINHYRCNVPDSSNSSSMVLANNSSSSSNSNNNSSS